MLVAVNIHTKNHHPPPPPPFSSTLLRAATGDGKSMQNYRKLRYATCVMGTDDIRCLVRLSVQFGIVYDLACSRQLFRALEDAPHREQSGDWYSDWKKIRKGQVLLCR